VPAEQAAQVDAKLAPTVGENKPTPQLTQAVAPVAIWYWPAPQVAQALDSAEPRRVEKDPVAQLMQVDAPEIVWYWPAEQFEQTLLLAPSVVPN